LGGEAEGAHRPPEAVQIVAGSPGRAGARHLANVEKRDGGRTVR
jgi:hypothetical protein